MNLQSNYESNFRLKIPKRQRSPRYYVAVLVGVGVVRVVLAVTAAAPAAAAASLRFSFIGLWEA